MTARNDNGHEPRLEASAAQDSPSRLSFLSAADFLAANYPPAEPLLGDPETITYVARSSLTMLYGDGGSAKSTLTMDLVAHLATGIDWLGIPVPRPVRVVMIENEGPAQLFQQKLEAKASDWDRGREWLDNVFVYAEPWGGY